MPPTNILVSQIVKPWMLVGLISFSSNTLASQCQPWQTNTQTNTPLIVGLIVIQTDNVFDPKQAKENRWHNRLANKLHRVTKPKVIQQQLLFKTGDRFNPAKLAESERLLRSNSFLREVQIRPREICHGKTVTILVRTSDNWTLTPGVSIGRSGGSNSNGLEFQEHNVLGYGKSLSLSYKTNTERNQTQLMYSDPHLFGTRHQLEISAQHNSDGDAYGIHVGLPFYQLDSRTAWGFSANTVSQENSFYDQGEVLYKIGEDTEKAELFYGWSAGQNQNQTSRYTFGWNYQHTNYFPTSSQTNTPSSDTQSYPWVAYEFLQDRYINRQNFRTMGKVEDIALGHQLAIKLGPVSKVFGADAHYLKLDLNYQKGFQASEKQLGLINLTNTSYIGKGKHQGSHSTAQADWFWFNNDRHSWHVLAQANAADNLQVGEQISLGGDTSLRGYPIGYQNGNKSALLRVEKRYYSQVYPLRLARLGATAFAEMGSAWGNGKKADWIGDIGVGLRFVSTRSSSGKVLHLNLAMPINTNGKADDYQILFGTQANF